MTLAHPQTLHCPELWVELNSKLTVWYKAFIKQAKIISGFLHPSYVTANFPTNIQKGEMFAPGAGFNKSAELHC
jgi:hypothetical protein